MNATIPKNPNDKNLRTAYIVNKDAAKIAKLKRMIKIYLILRTYVIITF
jgi:hypothetical protein